MISLMMGRLRWLLHWALPVFCCATSIPVSAQLFTDRTEASSTAVLGLYSTGCSWGDYDGDGLLDLYVTNWGTATSSPVNSLFHNDGDNLFTDRSMDAGVAVRGNSSAAAFADYDNDGAVDLYVADFYEQDRLFKNTSASTFTEVGRSQGLTDLEKQGSVVSLAWGDYDNDGFLDIYLGKYYFANDFYTNRGDGTFARVGDVGISDGRDAIDVSWFDYDNDGDLDLYLVNRDQENRLYRNDLSSSGAFSEVAGLLGVANDEIGQAAAWGDYDRDGDGDLYVGNVGANALYRNDSGENFVDVAAQAGVRTDEVGWFTADVAWSDLDGDGQLDLFLANGGDRRPQTDVVYLATNDGNFRNATSEAGILQAETVSFRTNVAIADYDGDGAPDIYATDGRTYTELPNGLFQNQTPGERFLSLKVRGRGGALGGSNASGLGARMTLYDGAGAIFGRRHVADLAGVSFGVDPEQTYRLEVFFPATGEVVSREGLTASDGLITITEP